MESIRTIYYFTGSGNSLYAAKQLTERLPGTNIEPILPLLQQETITPPTAEIGMVFPLHGITLPVPVKKFIEKLDLSQNRYFFALITRGGSVNLAFEKADRLLKRKTKGLDARFVLTMLNNDPKLEAFTVPTPAEIEECRRNTAAGLDDAALVIAARQAYTQPDTDHVDFPFGRFLNPLMYRLTLVGMWTVEHTNMNHYFYADDKCIGCGKCAEVCTSGKIKMDGKHPVWQRDSSCNFCYACVNFCPVEAVQIHSKWYMKSFTPVKGRYPHPFATLKDIAVQKTKE